jgi:hypothetical protein
MQRIISTLRCSICTAEKPLVYKGFLGGPENLPNCYLYVLDLRLIMVYPRFMIKFQAYIDGQYFHTFDSISDADTLVHWMGEGQTMCVVEVAS